MPELTETSSIRISGCLGRRHQANVSYLLHVCDRYGQFMLNPYRLRGRREQERPWDGEYAGKWLDAAAKTAVNTGHGLLTDEVNALARVLRAAQEPDGYMGIEASERKGRTAWDVWNHWYAITGWLTHYEQMGDKGSLESAARAGRWLVRVFSPIESQDAAFFVSAHEGGCNVDVVDQIVRLYALTGDGQFLDFVEQVIEHYPPIVKMRESGKLVIAIPLDGGKPPYKMHAYVILAYLGGLVNYATLTGNRQELDWIESVWEEMVEDHLYPTGSLGFQERLSADVPNDTPDMEHQETCATVEWMLFNRRLYSATGRARYIGMLERTIYNALLAAQSVDGMTWAYYSPLRYHKRWGIGPTRCCFWSGPRGVAMLPELVYASDEDSIYVNLFEQSQAELKVRGQLIRLRQTSGYPAEGSTSIELSLDGNLEFSLKLRIPNWVESPILQVNGKSVAVRTDPDEYVALSRSWAEGDQVKMRFDMPTRLVEMSRYGAAVARGPEVMALDSRDNEASYLDTVNMDQVRIPSDLELSPEEPSNGRRRYAGNVLLGGEPAQVVFTPYADAGAAVPTSHDPFRLWASFRTLFPRGE